MTTTAVDTPLGHLLRQLRADRALTQKELARRTGCSKGYLSRVENGLCAPFKSDLLVRIAMALELSDAERTALMTAAKQSRLVVHLPTTGSWKVYAGLHNLVGAFEQIDDRVLDFIAQVVERANTEKEGSSMPVS